MVDNIKGREPYILFGTFCYPQKDVDSVSNLYRWDFISNKLTKLLTLTGFNSIRSLARYKKCNKDIILFATQSDTNDTKQSVIYNVKTKYTSLIDTIENVYNTISLKYNNVNLIGSIWDFTLDIHDNTIYISIPQITLDDSKLSGFKISGRLYYNKIKLFLNKSCFIDLYSIIDNKTYPPGFDIDSISTFQVQTTKCGDIVYIYSLSDFVYQIVPLISQNNLNSIINKDSPMLEIIDGLRKLVSNLDIDGTRIFTISKKSLYKCVSPIITTIIGNVPYATINKSTTTNGYNNFLNVYTWASTNYKNDCYFGTLDIRASIYTGIVNLIISILPIPIPGLQYFLLSLPENIIILITEFFLNIDFTLPIDFTNKKLYFDIIKIDKDQNISKITSSGFSTSYRLSETADEGVRNLDIVKNKNGNFLLIGSTCYQTTNTAKVYTLPI
jgi:hypothetical protein